MSSDGKTAWVVNSSCQEKPWGQETSWNSPNSVHVKTFVLKTSMRNSLKFNQNKDELLICAAGELNAYFGDEQLITKGIGDLKVQKLFPGMALAVQSGCPYRLEAVKDSTVLEISTGSRATDSIVRLHDDYGRETKQISEFFDGVIEKWFLT
jgi:mannose-6-phosphate isomerase-like protein (cupin superfamily)